MKKAVVITAAILAVWALIIYLGRNKKPGSDYAPGTDGMAAEEPGDRSFHKAAVREAQLAIVNWPRAGQDAARQMMQKYGVPDETGRKRLVWNDNGPWKRTIVHRDAGRDVLEQVASYHVGNDRYELIGKLPGNVSAERGRDELSARSASEALNFLSLNLADEVLSGKRTIEDAHAVYDRTAQLAASGKATPYTESLLFAEPAQTGGRP